MKLFAVAGVGPNDLEIPLVIFSSREKAEQFISQFPKDEEYPDGLDTDFTELEGIYKDEETVDQLSDKGRELYSKLFRDGYYYPGCGGCYSLRILEVEEGKPMVGWDLD